MRKSPFITVNGDSDTPYIPVALAKKFLSPGRKVHSFMGGGFALMGCDVDKTGVLEDAEKYGISIAGPNMMAMQHGLAIIKPIPSPNGLDSRKVAIFYECRDIDGLKALAEQWEEERLEKVYAKFRRPKPKAYRTSRGLRRFEIWRDCSPKENEPINIGSWAGEKAAEKVAAKISELTGIPHYVADYDASDPDLE